MNVRRSRLAHNERGKCEKREKKRPREKFVIEKLAGSVAESRTISGVKRVLLCKMPVKGPKIDSLANFIQVDE